MEVTHNPAFPFSQMLKDKLETLESGTAIILLSDGSNVTVHSPVHIGTDYLEVMTDLTSSHRMQAIPLQNIVRVLF